MNTKEAYKLYKKLVEEYPNTPIETRKSFLQYITDGALEQYIEECDKEAEKELEEWYKENKEVLQELDQDQLLLGRSRSYMDKNGKITRLDPMGK